MLLEDIEEHIRQNPGRTATEIAKALFGDHGYHQRVNNHCLALTLAKRVERKGTGGPGDPYTYHPPDP